ncbi:MAG: Rrf2 family transcriptional regulator [Verrucomicrobiota bacterium]|nr:Rrf2 family transcriptional regulator [Verrucomicrobiota bacterium]
MEISQFTDYSLRVLIRAAVNDSDELITSRKIAEEYGISYNHIAKVTHNLASNGYLKTVRGRGGGVSLARPASQIGIGEIVRKTEDMSYVECLRSDGGKCCISAACKLKAILIEARAALLNVLDQYSLADIARRKSELRKLFRIK